MGTRGRAVAASTALVLLLAITGCGDSEPQAVRVRGGETVATPYGELVRWELAVAVGGDEPDLLVVSRSGRYWAVSSYLEETITVVDTVEREVRAVPALGRLDTPTAVGDDGTVYYVRRDQASEDRRPRALAPDSSERDLTCPDGVPTCFVRAVASDGRWLAVSTDSALWLVDTVLDESMRVPARTDAVPTALDLNDAGILLVRDGSLARTTSLSTGRTVTVARGMAQPGAEETSPIRTGSLSDDGSVTLLTSQGYARRDSEDAASLDVYRFDGDRRPEWVSRAVGTTGLGVAVSPAGRYVAFTALPDGDARHTQVLLWDERTGRSTTVSVAADGTPADRDASGDLAVSDVGQVTFVSYARNLVPVASDTGSALFSALATTT